MTQNTSHAVMAQRAEPNDSLDFFPTPPWATRALCEQLMLHHDISRHTVWEPACGQGHMLRPLGEYFSLAWGSDVHDYGVGAIEDFLWPTSHRDVDWIITNPPFRLGREFAIRAQEIAKIGVALLVRTAFLEGGERFATLFSQHRPSDVYQFCERVPMVKGRYDPKASTATSYCWIVWRCGIDMAPLVTAFHWIPPCRAKLECSSDSRIGIEIAAQQFPEPVSVAAASDGLEPADDKASEARDEDHIVPETGVMPAPPEEQPETAEVQQCASAAPVKVDEFEIPAFLVRKQAQRAEAA
jgi:hypothetical protein